MNIVKLIIIFIFIFFIIMYIIAKREECKYNTGMWFGCGSIENNPCILVTYKNAFGIVRFLCVASHRLSKFQQGENYSYSEVNGFIELFKGEINVI